AAAWLTVKTELDALLNPDALACNCLSVPATSIRKSLNDTVPFPTAVPISCAVVPCNSPLPAVNVSVTLRFAGNPTAESFPNGSRVTNAGWLPKTEPAVAAPGCALKTKRSAVAGLIVTESDVA